MTSIFGKYIKGSITLKYKPFSSLGTWGKTLSYPDGQTMPRPPKKKKKKKNKKNKTKKKQVLLKADTILYFPCNFIYSHAELSFSSNPFKNILLHCFIK